MAVFSLYTFLIFKMIGRSNITNIITNPITAITLFCEHIHIIVISKVLYNFHIVNYSNFY